MIEGLDIPRLERVNGREAASAVIYAFGRRADRAGTKE